MLSVIRKSLGLKVSLTLATLTLALTGVVGSIIISHQTQALEDATASKARLSAQLGAQAYGRLLEDAIDNGYVTVQDVFDRNYEEIKGYNWGGKPKYHTRYDFYTDRTALQLEDRFLSTPDFVGAIGADVNGYIPTHNTRYQKPLTGDPGKDLEGNRTKRIFNDEVALKAGKNEEAVLLQSYVRDTGERTWDVSSPVYVKGKHWGCFRILVSLEEIAKQRSNLILVLTFMFGGLALATTLMILAMIKRSVKPLVDLATLADQLSLGEGLENPIKPTTSDEVGVMAKSVDRLRASLKAAMSRLGE